MFDGMMGPGPGSSFGPHMGPGGMGRGPYGGGGFHGPAPGPRGPMGGFHGPVGPGFVRGGFMGMGGFLGFRGALTPRGIGHPNSGGPAETDPNNPAGQHPAHRSLLSRFPGIPGFPGSRRF